jgi:hypothetical protein
VHCYLDHYDHGEMTTIKSVLDQLAEAGVFFLTFSGGSEASCGAIPLNWVEHTRCLLFNVKNKTNAVMIHEEPSPFPIELWNLTVQLQVEPSGSFLAALAIHARF